MILAFTLEIFVSSFFFSTALRHLSKHSLKVVLGLFICINIFLSIIGR